MAAPEPWLRGIVAGLDPVVEHLLRASEQIREDVTGAMRDLRTDQVWATPHGMTSAGFHVKHLAGSTQRLCAYLEGRALTAPEIAAIKEESSGTEPAGDLIRQVNQAFDRYERLVRELSADQFGQVREIGRQRLETTAISLAIHIAEHGQRHAGQAISATKLARKIHG
jgi:hypothetical protein